MVQVKDYYGMSVDSTGKSALSSVLNRLLTSPILTSATAGPNIRRARCRHI
ncbi:hypothetical protein [Streptomyces sp. NPDC046759]|uniref:hypothetical protein n=1 Tax=Streptomyces sp. NPDC046759 TaxID=3155019 RepID=UPI003403DE1D